jgi:hypothetical protein
MKRRRLRGTPEDCAWPPHGPRNPPAFDALPDRVIGCRYAAHSNSTRLAVSMHATPRDKDTLFNVHAPVVFRDAKLVVNQSAAQRSVRSAAWQKINWPRAIPCTTDDDCTRVNPKYRCFDPTNPAPSKACKSFRRVKAPMAYVYGNVYPDAPKYSRLATTVKFYPGDYRDGAWVPAKFVDMACSLATRDDAACPAITEAKLVRFGLNPRTPQYPQPFTVTLERRRRSRKPRR